MNLIGLLLLLGCAGCFLLSQGSYQGDAAVWSVSVSLIPIMLSLFLAGYVAKKVWAETKDDKSPNFSLMNKAIDWFSMAWTIPFSFMLVGPLGLALRSVSNFAGVILQFVFMLSSMFCILPMALIMLLAGIVLLFGRNNY